MSPRRRHIPTRAELEAETAKSERPTSLFGRISSKLRLPASVGKAKGVVKPGSVRATPSERSGISARLLASSV